MKEIKLKSLVIENFKGINSLTLNCRNITKIFGRNATGKTTIEDSILWLLFNIDSTYSTKFAVRPLDNDGNMIHNIEIKVTANFEVEGIDYELAKTQKEIWIKHKGNENAEFEGNKNEFSINGYPKSEKDYKAFINETIGDIEVFKMLIDPRYFASLDWKKQRQIIMSLYSDMTDSELATKGEFQALVPELNIASTDDIKNKYSKALKSFKEKQKEIPVRIDEANNSKVDIDASAIELERNTYQEELNVLLAKSQSNNNELEISELRNKKIQIDSKRKLILAEAESKVADKSRETKDEVYDLEFQKKALTRDIDILNKRIEDNKLFISTEQEKRIRLGAEYNQQQALEFDESIWNLSEDSEICPNCGQKLPQERIAEIYQNNKEKCEKARKEFEDTKASRMKDLWDKAQKSKKDSATANDNISADSEKLNATENTLRDINIKLESLNSKPVSSISDFCDMAEVDSLQKEIEKIDNRINSINANANVTSYDEEIKVVKGKIVECDKQLSLFANNTVIDDRIEELRNEQIEVSQKIAEQEKMLYILDEFIKYKLNFISGEINKHFKNVGIKLFNLQINGSVSETCEITLNGVNYANLNSGHKIVAGIEVINTLQEIYEIKAPIFIDNAESINSDNVPDTNCQVISMFVSDDKSLRVENE